MRKLMITELLPIGSFLISIIGLLLTIFLWRRIENSALSKLEGLALELNSGLESIWEDMKPVKDASSRAMGVISNLSDDGKMDKALNRRIGQDLIAQNEDVLEVLSMAFPRVSEYIEDHPEAVTKLMPRLNSLLSDPETRKRLNFDTLGKSDIDRIHRG